MSTRIYLVDDKTAGIEGTELVSATSKAQAISAVVRHRYAANVATQTELVKLVSMGKKVIDATAEASQE